MHNYNHDAAIITGNHSTKQFVTTVYVITITKLMLTFLTPTIYRLAKIKKFGDTRVHQNCLMNYTS